MTHYCFITRWLSWLSCRHQHSHHCNEWCTQLLDLSPRDHVASALKSFHWLPVKQRIEFKLCLLVHLAINGQAPIYLKDLIKTTASVPGRASNRSASNNDLVIQRTRLKLGGRAFFVAAPRVWNQLPTELKAAIDTVIQTESENSLVLCRLSSITISILCCTLLNQTFHHFVMGRRLCCRRQYRQCIITITINMAALSWAPTISWVCIQLIYNYIYIIHIPDDMIDTYRSNTDPMSKFIISTNMLIYFIQSFLTPTGNVICFVQVKCIYNVYKLTFFIQAK